MRGGTWTCECPTGQVAADPDGDTTFECLSAAFHASASTDQTVGDTAYACAALNNDSSGENFDSSGSFRSDTITNLGITCGQNPDDTSGAYFVPADGDYFFQACALWDNANLAESRNAIFIRHNHTDEFGEWEVSGGTDFFGTCASGTLQVQQGDRVYVRLYNGDSMTMDTFSQSGKYVFFSGFKLD